MKYTEEAQEKIDILKTYKEVEKLEYVDLLHLYDTGKCCVNDDSGYHDSRHFMLWGFNVNQKKKINLGIHDAVSFGTGRLSENGDFILFVRIFVDGSTLIRFKYPVAYTRTQDIDFYKPNSIQP